MDFGNILPLLPKALILSALVLIGNPLILMSIMGILGYKKKTSLQTGFTVAQISEFSLIVIALGAKMAKADGQVTRDEVTAFREVFHIAAKDEAGAAKVFNLARQDVAGYEDYARRIGSLFKGQSDTLRDLLEPEGSAQFADDIAKLDGTARRFGLTTEKVVITVGHHGNTSAASIPLALDVAREDGRLQPGKLVLMEAMGGGFTWGAVLARW